MDTEEKEMCMNCKRDISVANYQMHTAHCARHITLCQNCDEPIPKKEFPDHRCGGGGGDTEGPTSVSGGQHILSSGTDEPPPTPKPRADKKSAKSSGTKPKVLPPVEKTQVQELPDRICPYCQLEFTQKQLEDHQDYCGSRTEQCPECSDFVMLKDWDKHQSMRLYHELANKPSALVFKKEEENQRSLQRSASGVGIPTTANLLPKKSSQSNLFSHLLKDSSKPFGEDFKTTGRKNSAAAVLDYNYNIPTTKTIRHSFDASPLRPEKSQQILSRQLDKNLSSESLIDRRASNTSSSSINRLERRNSGSWNSNYTANTNILGIEDVTDLPDDTNHNDFGTSVEEQRRILEEIQKNSRRRSISRNRLENITSISSTTSSNYYRAKSSNPVQDDSNNHGSGKKSVKSVLYQESSLEVTGTVNSNSSIVDRYSRVSRRDEFKSNGGDKHLNPVVDDSASQILTRSKSSTSVSGPTTRRKKSYTSSSIVDQVLGKKDNQTMPSGFTKNISNSRKKSITNNVDIHNHDDDDMPDLMTFETPFEKISTTTPNNMAAKKKSLPSRFTQGGVIKPQIQTNPDQNIGKTKKTSFVDQYVTVNPHQNMSTNNKHDLNRTTKNVRIRSETDNNLIPEPETSSSSSSQRKSQQQSAKRKRSRSRNLLCRQDSVTNLSSLQDEISSMLNNNNNAGDSAGITETNGSSNFYNKSTNITSSSDYNNITSSAEFNNTMQATSVIKSSESHRSFQSRCSYEALVNSMMSDEPIRRHQIHGLDHTEVHRENLREMLSKMRKDPLDDDLEKCDGEYFPCEFCGDPYPVEYLMRHQLSCDLNPNPVQEGNGFDYSEIARRAAATMSLAKD